MKKLLLIVVVCATLGACGTSPEPDYFVLAPVDGKAVPDVKLVVEMRRPSFPEYLDRPDIVAQGKDDQMRIAANNRWAEPLDRMFERVLAQDLRQRLPAATIMAEDEGLFTVPPVIVTVNVTQFNRIDDGQASLQASIAVQDRNTHEQPAQRYVRYATSAGTSDTNVAESLSALTARMADALASILRDQAAAAPKPD